MAAQGLRFGVQLASEGVTWQDFLDTWKAAEDCGYHSAWTADHFISTIGGGQITDPHTDYLEGWMALAALAQATKRLRLGPLVSGNMFRNPAVLAKMAATVDHISGGRLEFGIGAGWFEYEHHALGLGFPSPGERLKRLDEAIQVVKLLWTEREATFQGKYYTLDKAPALPKPVQKPHPPIVIGAFGEKVALKIVAKHAGHWNTVASPERYADRVRALEQHCAAIGRDPRTIRRSIMIGLYLEETPIVRSVIEKRAQLTKRTPEDARQWFLVGDRRELQERLDAFARLGVELVIVQLQEPGRNAERVRQFARMFL